MVKDVFKLTHALKKPVGDVDVAEIETSSSAFASAAPPRGTTTSKRPAPRVPSDERFTKPLICNSEDIASVPPSDEAETSTCTRVFEPSVRMTLFTPASALMVPEELASPDTTIPPVALTAMFSAVSAFAAGAALRNASKTDMRSNLFMRDT